MEQGSAHAHDNIMPVQIRPHRVPPCLSHGGCAMTLPMVTAQAQPRLPISLGKSHHILWTVGWLFVSVTMRSAHQLNTWRTTHLPTHV